VAGLDLVTGRSEDCAVGAENDRANRDLTPLAGSTRLGKGGFHGC
jgi:hypothetical protein